MCSFFIVTINREWGVFFVKISYYFTLLFFSLEDIMRMVSLTLLIACGDEVTKTPEDPVTGDMLEIRRR